ncbi:MAG: hypothetical protein NZ528_08215 [Caldilineales bacterium]|nr:hypothetical protein [Caldilineales bacterium]MDW8316564.1 hypothetical protein [Anaerolineae bacterium]
MEQDATALQRLTQPTLDYRALTPPTPRAERLAVLWTLLTLALALFLGWALMLAVNSRTATFSDPQLSLQYPAGWAAGTDDEGNAVFRNLGSESLRFHERITVIHAEAPSSGLPAASPLAEAATAWTLSRSQALSSFRNLATVDGLTVADQPAIRVDYAYVADPTAALGRPGVPVVVRGSDYLFLVGNQMHVISGQATEADWSAFEKTLAKVVASVRLNPAPAP